jgi:hypothetical protein
MVLILIRTFHRVHNGFNVVHSKAVCYRFCNNSSTTGVTGGAETPYPSGVHPNFRGVKVTRSLIFYVAFSKSLFVLFLLVIVLSVLQSTASDYAFGILKLFCYYTTTIVKLLNDKQRKNNP